MARLMVNSYLRKKVYVAKPTKRDPDATQQLGRVRLAVFAPGGKRLVGYLVKRPDIAGMVKRPDTFVAWQALGPTEGGLLVKDPEASLGDAAIKGLGVDWDACIMWAGMDARTTDGRDLGFVSDAVFNGETGAVIAFCVGDGGMAEQLVGAVQIPSGMLVGYEAGRMIVDAEAASLALTGGVAARAGEGYAKAKAQGARALAQADDVASRAVSKGSKALGRQIGRTKGMFGSFMDEFKKASE